MREPNRKRPTLRCPFKAAAGLLALLLFTLFTFGPLKAWADQESAARALVHVLDYVGRDYRGAVEDGKVLNEFEYGEQREFAGEALHLAEMIPSLGSAPEVFDQLRKLAAVIEAKGPASEVEALCSQVTDKVLFLAGLSTVPRQWPSAPRGTRLFETNCVPCHGARGAGDGPQAATLKPPPANMQDEARMLHLSPFSIFNTIRLGVQGTAMAAYPDLTDEEIWDLAFYASSLRHEETPIPEGLLEKIPPELSSLKSRASYSDQQILEKLKALGLPQNEGLAALRQIPPRDRIEGFAVARGFLEEVRKEAGRGNLERAGQLALSAYLDGLEPFEPLLRTHTPEHVLKIESHMAALREAIRAKAGTEKINAALDETLAGLDEIERSLAASEFSPWVAFVSAAAILLREGLEAALIVVILLSILRAWEAPQLRRQVHLGWVIALVAGGLTWLASEKLFTFSGAGRENLEGFASLLAVVILLYVGFWLHRAVQGETWKRKVNDKAREYLEKGRGMGLFLLAFLAVYREAFETVLFYRALWLEGGAASSVPLAGGFLLGALGVAVLCVAIFWFEAKLPVRQVFLFSAAVLAGLALILTGKGVHALQESGVLEIHIVPLPLRLDVFGFYPTGETLLAQAIVLVLIALLWWMSLKEEAVAEAASESPA